jgi:serine/threonine-protein kinase PknG
MTTRSCQTLHCPGEVDRDGYCRRWGHECAGPPAATAVEPAAPVVSQRHWALTDTRPWEQARVLPRTLVRSPRAAMPAGPVAAHARRCGNCRQPVTEIDGYCTNCGTRYSFRPPLAAGEVVAGRYLINGCLGYGGVGWVFLARDQSMDQAWSVLKGLRNPADRDAAEAFLGERSALINHKHQRIVAILDVVAADQAAGGPYLVMEFIPGGTLEEARSLGPQDPTAVDVVQALGFADQILDAFEFLHGRGLLYCDLKPDNVMRVPLSQVHDQDPIKLIDFGAVRRIDDHVTPPWGTPGLQAPEVETLGPQGTSIRSDLYTVGRTLMALTLTDRTSLLESRFPPGQDLLDRVELPEVYLRFLNRATALDPDHRFGSATEMRMQLQGVLRQLRAADTGEPEPGRSTVFSPSACAFALHVGHRRLDVAGLLRQLPTPLVNRADPAAAFLASLGPDSDEVLAQLGHAPGPSDGAFFRTVRAHLAVALIAADDRAAGRRQQAEEEIKLAKKLLADRPQQHYDWALWWHRGLIALVEGHAEDARHEFDQAFSWLPGEVSARLAYAVAAELCGDIPAATEHYEGIWATDPGVVAAGYGLARCVLSTADDRDGLADTVRAAGVVAGLPDSDEKTAAELEIIHFAVRHFADRMPARGQMFDVALTPADLGAAFEQRSLRLAARTASRRRRVELVDAANRLRPVSWF